MKTAPFIAVALIGALYAEESTSRDPNELVELRNQWERAKENAIKPINEKYYSALETIKLKFTKAGNLQAALAVQKEIESLKPATDKKTFPDAVVSVWWSWTTDKRAGDRIILNQDKTASHTHDPRLTWSVTGDREITLFRSNGDKAILVWNATYTGYKGNDFGTGRMVSGSVILEK